MYVIHLEQNELIRLQLARLLGVQAGGLGPYQYLETDAPTDVRRMIHSNQVQVLILDVALNPAWDNKHLLPMLRHLVLGEALPVGVRLAECPAHGLCLLAFQHHIPTAILTNYMDYTGGDSHINEEKLAEVFRVKGVFHKNGRGMSQCVHWICQLLKLSLPEYVPST